MLFNENSESRIRKCGFGLTHYKGNSAGYWAKHKYLAAYLGKADHCELDSSHVNRRYEWANLDHKYKRHPRYYIQLCMSCHKLYDNGELKIRGKTILQRGGSPVKSPNYKPIFAKRQRGGVTLYIQHSKS